MKLYIIGMNSYYQQAEEKRKPCDFIVKRFILHIISSKINQSFLFSIILTILSQIKAFINNTPWASKNFPKKLQNSCLFFVLCL